MEQTITIKVTTEKTSISVTYEPDEIKALGLALIGDEPLRETALLASAYIIATSPEPSAVANGLLEMVNDIIKENSGESSAA